MIIKQKSFFVASKTLPMLIIAMALAGCSNFGSSFKAEAEAAASTRQTGQISVSDVTRQHQNFEDFTLVAIRPSPWTVNTIDPQDMLLLQEIAKISRKLDIQVQVKQAEIAFREQQIEEALVVAAIEKELTEIRNRSNAWYRLQQGMQLTPVSNKRVTAQLNWYLDHRGYLQRVMVRARPILPFVLDELERRNLPSELALLPIVESAYQAFAYSHGRASGMWQIIPSTGRFLGLKQNWWYDGRRDIVESTRAAIHYLDSLSQQFDGDWELALAAYNAGPGRIRSAVRYNRKRNRQTDFWHLTRIRNETRSYVPKMFALKELFANPEKYQLDLIPVGNQVSYEIVELDGQIDLALAAEVAGITLNELYQLNPAFNRWATAPNGPHRLLLPLGKAEQYQF